ncbi:MAG: hypothetical protein IIA02_14255 [Proteobacteria bacterium]|uniref:hypothetical protein n=1 Tax=Aquabacterium sp. TaxID=1872578 RepID=UPI0035C77F34|nr:hypothetical protein [Pseudomonadota bacterium]
MRLAHWLLLCATALAAVASLRIRCEGFGCMGVGVLWLAWTGLYLLTFVVGLLALLRRPPGSARGPILWPLLGQGLGGLVLAAYWLRQP